MMRFNLNKICSPFIFKAATLGLISAGIVGCTNDYDDLNTPKDQITVDQIDVGKIGQLFANAEYNGLQGSRGAWELLHELHSDIYAQIFTTTSSGFDTDQFSENSSWVNTGWSDFYAGPAVSIHYIQQFTEKNNMEAEHAIANIWSIPMYQRMTDFFGPIIFSQFGNEKTSVAYDSQEDIYNQFFTILDASITTLKAHAGETAFGNNDIIFGGVINKWITFANSLRLRVAMRIAYVNPEKAKAEAEKAVADGVITDNAQGALMSTTDKSVSLATQWTYINPFTMSATSESLLIGFQDPRLPFFFNQGGGRLGGNMGYHGLRNGLTKLMKTAAIRSGAAGNSFVATQFLPLNDGGSNSPYPVMNAAEMYFLRAEGALRGWNMNGTAEELYNQGIRHSLNYWTDANASAVEAYVSSSAKPSTVNDNFNTPPESDITIKFDNSGSFERKLEQIITQKWLDMHLNGWECWAERRRTGYPRGYAIVNSLNSEIKVNELVRRISYPPNEYSNNSIAVNKAVSELLNGEDKTNTRLWWDKKPLSDYPDLTNTIVSK